MRGVRDDGEGAKGARSMRMLIEEMSPRMLLREEVDRAVALFEELGLNPERVVCNHTERECDGSNCQYYDIVDEIRTVVS